MPDTLLVNTDGEMGLLQLTGTDRLPREPDANDPGQFYVDVYLLPQMDNHMSFPDDGAVLSDVQAIRAQLDQPLSTPTE